MKMISLVTYSMEERKMGNLKNSFFMEVGGMKSSIRGSFVTALGQGKRSFGLETHFNVRPYFGRGLLKCMLTAYDTNTSQHAWIRQPCISFLYSFPFLSFPSLPLPILFSFVLCCFFLVSVLVTQFVLSLFVAPPPVELLIGKCFRVLTSVV